MDSMRSNHRCHSKLVRAGSTPTFSLMHLLVPGAYRLLIVRLLIGGQKVSMHLLVPGAYRPLKGGGLCLHIMSQCTFWCRVLTDAKEHQPSQRWHKECQCTFWCRVLTDGVQYELTVVSQSLNAPSGAGCLPTDAKEEFEEFFKQSQCTFWCRVLTDRVSALV